MKSTVVFRRSHSPFFKHKGPTSHRHIANDNVRGVSFETVPGNMGIKALGLAILIVLCLALFILKSV